MGSVAVTDKVVGIYNNRDMLDDLLNELNDAGFGKDNISVLAKESDIHTNDKSIVASEGYTINGMPDISSRNFVDSHPKDNHDISEKNPKAMVRSAATGGALGLVAGLALLMIPGLGPVLAAGPLVAALTAAAGGAAFGTTAGTLIGLLNDEGIPNDRTEIYNNHFHKGDVLVIVHTDATNKNQVRDILLKYNPVTIDTF